MRCKQALKPDSNMSLWQQQGAAVADGWRCAFVAGRLRPGLESIQEAHARMQHSHRVQRYAAQRPMPVHSPPL